MRGKATLIALCLLALMVPARRAAAVEEVPGDSCAGNPTNSWIWSGGPENGGVKNGMFCNTNWLGVINFQSSGNVGIGTTTPGGTLNVFNSATNTTSLLVKGASDGGGTYKNQRIVDFQRSDGHSLFYINTAGSENWGKVTTDNINVLYQLGVGYDVGAGAGTAATFAVNGTVGIGTQTPGAKLDIGLAGTTLGTLRLEGNTSGYVQIQPAAAAGSWTMTLPTAAGTSGYVLSTDGTGITSWIAPSAGTPAGANTQVQFNSGGAFGASANYTWNNGTQALTIAGSQTTTNATSGGTAVSGIANTGAGVAVKGSTTSTTATATGVYGLASGASGATYGVYGSDASATGYGGYFTNTNGGYALATGSGNVGIGTTTPGSLLDVGLAGTTLGTLRLEGNTSGYVQLQTAAAAGSWTMTLPPNAGTSGYVLRTDGAGVTTWVAQGGGTTLDAITAAAGAQAGIANGNNAIVWNWALTTAAKTGMAFGETSAATSGAGSQYLASFSTLAGSTATPLKIADSLTGSQTLPALSILPTWNTTGVVDAALLINATNTASGTGSKLIDAQIGGATQFSVDKSGTLSLASLAGAAAPGAVANYSEMSGNSNGGTLAAGATKYGPANGILTMTATAPVVAAATASMVSRAATVQNLYYSVGIAANANAHTVTVYKNGASTALTCAVANGATTCNDTTHSFSVVAGDYLSIQVVTAASAAVGTAAWSIELSY